MTVYRRGSTYWYKFMFQGQLVRESAKTESKTVAKEAEKQRRREMEEAYNRIPQKKSAPLFATAAKEWLATKETKAPKTVRGYQQRIKPLVSAFGKRLLYDISGDDLLAYWSARKRAGASNRTINYETCCLRGVLKRNRLWQHISQEFAARDIRLKLKENHDVGRALSIEDEDSILAACKVSKAPSLLPLFIFARDTGLRAAEMKILRHRDLRLEWKQGVIVSGEVVVPKSKTEAGKGRGVPMSPDVCGALTLWLSRFPDAISDSFVFPRHQVEMLKGGKDTKIVNPILNRPVQSWQRAWRTALKEAGGLHYRWHDLRHTFVSRLAENPGISEQTIKSLAGHVSKQMMERYSHIRTSAKQEAIAALHSARNNNKKITARKNAGVGTKLGTKQRTRTPAIT
jgi:integrase